MIGEVFIGLVFLGAVWLSFWCGRSDCEKTNCYRGTKDE